MMRMFGVYMLIALACFSLMGCVQGGAEGSIGPCEPAVSEGNLPALSPGDTVLVEHADYRVVLGDVVGTEDGSYNTLQVQHRANSDDDFTVLGTFITYEAIVGNGLVISEGTGVVSDVRVYDVRTGDPLLTLAYPTAGLPLVVEDGAHFSYYCYNSDAPCVEWSESKGGWIEHDELLPAMRNASLEEAKRRMADFLFNGMTLQPYQRVRVNVETLEVELLDEYKWGYAE